MRKSILEPTFVRQMRIKAFQKTIDEKFLRGKDENLRRGDFDSIDRETLFKVVKDNSVEGAEDVFFWGMKVKDVYFIFVGFGVDTKLIDCDGGFLLIIARKLSEDALSLFTESAAIKLDMEDLDAPDNYTGNALSDFFNMYLSDKPRSKESEDEKK